MKLLKNFALIACLGCTLVLTGCSAPSLFSSYPSQLGTIKKEVAEGEFEKAEKKLGKNIESNDKILYLMEQGRVTQLAGNYEKSQKEYEAAIAAIRAHNDKALYTVTGGAAQTNAVLVNDNVLPYYGSPYEVTLLHHYQALNYAALGDLEGALVEVRRASSEQKMQQESHEKEMEKARKHKADVSKVLKDKHFNAINTDAASIKSGFLNAYTYYFSGVLYEAAGLNNDAYIDYKKASELAPNNTTLKTSIKRVDGKRSANKNKGQLVVIFEENFIQPKQEFRLPLPTGAGLIHITLPYYKDSKTTITPLQVSFNKEHSLGSTEILANVQTLANKSLSDDLNGIVLREVTRQLTRVIAEQAAKKQNNNTGAAALMLATNIYAFATANADLRSWLTLPHQVQILSQEISPGAYTLTLAYSDNTIDTTVNIEAGKITLLLVESINSHLTTREIIL